ncbi:hypothetical protein ACGFX8_15580 [Streptomyces sp. NPDC048362]|uniref:hypothetical protein n=1 Tax=Streptomyces sp. NPDC048362 TaxID=3365539 RepID=UPI003723E8D4
MATGWSGAEITSGGSTYYDREQADRRSRAHGPRANSSDYFDHYVEKAEAREAEKREAEEYRNSVECDREWRTRYETKERYATGNPEPRFPDDGDEDFTERAMEWQDWQARKDEYLMRVEGEQIAARIGRRW